METRATRSGFFRHLKKGEKIMLDLIKNLKFWETVCYLIGLLTLQFAPQYAVDAGALLLAVLAVLKLFNVVPEVRAAMAVRAKALKSSKKK